MIASSITNKMLRSLGDIGYSPGDLPKNYSFSGTLKEVLVNTHVPKEVSIINSSFLEVTMQKSDYLSALMTDIHFGKERVANQTLNMSCQVENEQHPAWLLVSTYYASYFLACDIAKICGQFITNIPSSGVKELLTQVTNGSSSQFNLEGDASFAANVSRGRYENEIVIKLNKTAAKPHKVAWSNLFGIIRDIKCNDPNIGLDRLKEIVDSNNTRWRLPSTIRNEWNYSSTHYYGEKGTELANSFITLMKNSNSSFKRFSNNTLHPNEENITASIAFVYETLNAAYSNTLNQIRL